MQAEFTFTIHLTGINGQKAKQIGESIWQKCGSWFAMFLHQINLRRGNRPKFFVRSLRLRTFLFSEERI